MTDAILIERESIKATFRDWQAEQDALDAELSESLAALSAFQSHLDTWQQQLARERESLQREQKQLKRERREFEEGQSSSEKSSAEHTAEITAAREKIAALSSSLLDRTEELRTSDQRRAELVTELELTRAREKDLKATFDDQKRTLETERAQWAEELKHMREILERRPDAAAPNDPSPTPNAPAPSKPARTNASSNTDDRLKDNPVLGSIVQQFGKLRQQRASDREAMKKAR